MSELNDPRNIATGRRIPAENYCDQPYVVVNDDGSWLCIVTTGRGVEGEPGQHIVAAVSADQWATWSEPVPIEPADGPEASWAQPLKVPSGRVYVFYTYNRDNLREVKADDPPFKGGVCRRVDSFGVYAYKFSDDGGRTWSLERFEAPMRPFEIDRRNVYGGRIRFFWGVGKPFIHRGTAYVPSSKVGGFGHGFFTSTEGMTLASDNLASEPDPHKHRWETLPLGEIGLRAPRGPVAEEHNVTVLGDGSLYCTYRTTQGHPCHAYSRDGGRTWTPPAFMTYTPGGRLVKNPRAANFVRRFSNGKFIYWFENHGGLSYEGRNPAWLCGGVEVDGFIHWSQPEIVLYDDDPGVRISYPDFIEQAGRYFITETQKTVARVHEVDAALLEGMWRQGEAREVARRGLVLELAGEQCASGAAPSMPPLPRLNERRGFSLDFTVRFDDLSPGQVILDARADSGAGICLSLTDRGTIRLSMSGMLNAAPGGTWLGCSACEAAWDCDPGAIAAGRPHHVAVIVDGGPRVITFVVDGVLCDGGAARQFGWGRFHPDLGDVNGAGVLRIAPSLRGTLHSLRLYDLTLRTSEAVANSRNQLEAHAK